MNATVPPSDERETGAVEPPDDEMSAAELVLGVLGTEQRRAAQARAEADAAFAERVAGWERRFAPWLAEIPLASAPAATWNGISHRLGWRVEDRTSGLWQSLTLWRSVAALAAIAALGLWLLRTSAPPSSVRALSPAEEAANRPVITLARGDGTPGWLVSIDRRRGTVLVMPVPSAADAQGRVPELWIIPNGKAPRSLGLLSIDKSDVVAVPADARAALIAGSVLAVSLERASGVPHAAPSGPIIAKGAITS